jgi:hypothetical protein
MFSPSTLSNWYYIIYSNSQSTKSIKSGAMSRNPCLISNGTSHIFIFFILVCTKCTINYHQATLMQVLNIVLSEALFAVINLHASTIVDDYIQLKGRKFIKKMCV